MKTTNLKKWKITKTGKIFISAVFILLVVDWFIYKQISNQLVVVNSDLPTIDSKELLKYDGNDPNVPIYLALDGYVYDVSPGRADFYGPGQSYHDIVGKDSSALLHIIGGDIVKRKYKIVGVYRP
ncbi:MAG: cytochrome b5 domain-containing protein [Microgenomates group bacterium]